MDDMDYKDDEDLDEEKRSDFMLSDKTINAIVAAELMIEMMGASPAVSGDMPKDMVEELPKDIVIEDVISDEESLDEILEEMGFTIEGTIANLGAAIENLGSDESEALENPLDRADEIREELEIETIMNNTPTTSDDIDKDIDRGDKDDGDAKDSEDGGGEPADGGDSADGGGSDTGGEPADGGDDHD